MPDSEKRIREAPLATAGGSGGGSGGTAAPANPMMALQDALNKRKKKVANNSGMFAASSTINMDIDAYHR